MQAVQAAEELLDELVVRQAGDVRGADGHLALPPDGDGLVGGGEGLLPGRRRLLLKLREIVRATYKPRSPPPPSPLSGSVFQPMCRVTLVYLQIMSGVL